MSDKVSELKEKAAQRAVEYIESGMVVGLGTGSTTLFAIRKIGELVNQGKLKDIRAIPSSLQSEKVALELGITLISFDDESKIDITIDGADEVDEDLNLIKGGGGALLREKVLAQNSKELIIIVDEKKLSIKLGTKWHVPIEVIPFAENAESEYLRKLGARTKVRENLDGTKFITDNRNLIIDANFGIIEDVNSLSSLLDKRAGILEHGLFVKLTDRIIVGTNEGVKIIESH